MKGQPYKENDFFMDDELCGGRTFYCVEDSGKKIHVIDSWNRDRRIEVLGLCDGSCVVELDVDFESVVKNYMTTGVKVKNFSTSIFSDNIPQEIIEELEEISPLSVPSESIPEEIQEELFVTKLVTKVNRWSKRYRWNRQRCLVTDFS